MSTLTAQIAGVNLWHGMSWSLVLSLGMWGGEERGGAEVGVSGLTLVPAVRYLTCYAAIGDTGKPCARASVCSCV